MHLNIRQGGCVIAGVFQAITTNMDSKKAQMERKQIGMEKNSSGWLIKQQGYHTPSDVRFPQNALTMSLVCSHWFLSPWLVIGRRVSVIWNRKMRADIFRW